MKKEELEIMIDNGKSLNQISKDTGKSLTTIRYWVKKYDIPFNTKNFSEQGIKEYGQLRFCPKCKNNCSIDEFYNRRGKKGSSVYCKKCTTDQVVERTKKLKQLMVDYKGGCCQVCGYNKYIGSLDFHHINPEEKDFTIAHIRHYKFDDLIKKELDKCLLVCSNCHREIHGGITLVNHLY
jgi:hypothetical protein